MYYNGKSIKYFIKFIKYQKRRFHLQYCGRTTCRTKWVIEIIFEQSNNPKYVTLCQVTRIGGIPNIAWWPSTLVTDAFHRLEKYECVFTWGSWDLIHCVSVSCPRYLILPSRFRPGPEAPGKVSMILSSSTLKTNK